MKMRLMTLLLVFLVGVGMSVGTASAHELNPDSMGALGFDPHPGALVPRDLQFRDETGQVVLLGDYFGVRPIVLTLNYLSCPNLCPIMLQNLAADLNQLPFMLGQQYDVVTVSIDPRDTPDLANHAKLTALQGTDHPESVGGWHVLTGSHASIDRLADAVGFSYAYDSDQDEYAHPAGVIVLTSAGTVSRYLYGLDYAPTDLRLALVEAAQGQVGSIVDQVLLLCFHYQEQSGRYTPIVLNLVRGAGLATLLAIVASIVVLSRIGSRRQSAGAAE